MQYSSWNSWQIWTSLTICSNQFRTNSINCKICQLWISAVTELTSFLILWNQYTRRSSNSYTLAIKSIDCLCGWVPKIFLQVPFSFPANFLTKCRRVSREVHLNYQSKRKIKISLVRRAKLFNFHLKCWVLSKPRNWTSKIIRLKPSLKKLRS